MRFKNEFKLYITKLINNNIPIIIHEKPNDFISNTFPVVVLTIPFLYLLFIKLSLFVKDGFFLSGGIDSGSVVSVSNKIFKKKINSFSIYQKNIKNYDESKIISKISKKFRYKKFYIDTKNIKIYSTLKEMISYYNSPVLTLNNLIQSCLYKLMKKKNKTI